MVAKQKNRRADDSRLADLNVAYTTVGSTNTDRLAWLVGFAREDQARWHSAERAARGDCLVALAK